MKQLILTLFLALILLSGCDWVENDPFTSPVETPEATQIIKIPELMCKNGYCTVK